MLSEIEYLKDLKDKVANHAYEFDKPLIEIIDNVNNHLIKEHQSIWNACLSTGHFCSSDNLATDVKKLVEKLSNPEIKDGAYMISVLTRKFKHAELDVNVHHMNHNSNNELTVIDDLETATMRHDFEIALSNMIKELEEN